jgi:hypothetical protein
MSSIEVVTANSNDDRIAFEKGIYEAFSKRNPGNWICSHYTLIDPDRYRPLVPYEDQMVLLVKENGQVIFGASFNLNMGSPVLQMRQIGFEPDPEWISASYAEALVFYTLRNTAVSPFETGLQLKKVLNQKMREKKVRTILGTCSENVKIVYLKSGWKIVREMINAEGIRKYLIRTEINP